jgi:circadian clock protein KaiC
VLRLEQMAPAYGAARRRLSVVKVRGAEFRGGYHDYIIRSGGITVFPRLVAAPKEEVFTTQVASSGIEPLDSLTDGGLDRGTSNLFMGPPGTGKSTLAAQFAVAAAMRGERVAVFTFDEKIETYIGRCDALGMKLSQQIEDGMVQAVQINPAELSPGEFTHRIRRAVERENVRMVIIDSLNGYLNAMPEERALTIQMHELLSYLAQRGVVTILALAQHGLVGAMQSPVDVTYLADTVVVLRYFEVEGAVKQAISVIKKRSGNHERTIREFQIRRDGIHVGAPLKEFHGVLTGVPTYKGLANEMMGNGSA